MKNRSFFESFRHALDGIKTVLREERNMRVHISMTVLVIMFGVLFGVTKFEMALLLSLCGAVICAELINSAIENAVNICAPVFNMYAKKAKDAAAGAVLALCIFAAAAGIVIFIPYGIKFLTTL